MRPGANKRHKRRTRWKPVSKDFIRQQKRLIQMRDYQAENEAREAAEKLRNSQLDAILAAVSGIATGTHCIVISHAEDTRIWIEPRS